MYRPWIRDARVIPAGDAKVAATGYSLPSGHTTCATSVYGTAAIWQWKKRRAISIAFLVLLALTMFSRNYLGVHTPQDVIVAFVMTAGVICFNVFLINWIDKDRRREVLVFFIGIAIVVAALIFYNVKTYPMDYVDGNLIVDPIKMMPDSYKSSGWLLGFVIGWFVERRFIGFKTEGSPRKRLIIAIIALIPLYIIYTYTLPALTPLIGKANADFVAGFSLYIYITIPVPFVLKKLG